MSDNKIVFFDPAVSTKAPCKCANKSCKNSITENENRNIGNYKFKKLADRDYVGKYCLVDWLDDNAIIDCSLLHEWD